MKARPIWVSGTLFDEAVQTIRNNKDKAYILFCKTFADACLAGDIFEDECVMLISKGIVIALKIFEAGERRVLIAYRHPAYMTGYSIRREATIIFGYDELDLKLREQAMARIKPSRFYRPTGG